jgi:hypothetical protein
MKNNGIALPLRGAFKSRIYTVNCFEMEGRVEVKVTYKDHAIENVTFENVTRYGKPLMREIVKMNEFVDNLIISCNRTLIDKTENEIIIKH